jgi:hypothetical protein
MSRSQYSIEYMITIGFGLMVIAAMIAVYAIYQRSSETETDMTVVNVMGQEIVDNANAIGLSGGYSLKKLELGVTERVNSIYIEGGYSNRIAINYTGTTGNQTAIFMANQKVVDLSTGRSSQLHLVKSLSGAIAMCSESNCSCRLADCCAIPPCPAGTQLCVSSVRSMCVQP